MLLTRASVARQVRRAGLAAAAVSTLVLAASASVATYRYDCRRLCGNGSYSHPLALGT
ncbi:hypothetical protein ABZ341_06540 [Streptomyces sp. NPDC006173]|uniref:hypothetical protein n=1 Tax=Streptomyces sp. NPDC006173 TaxID=3155349 RepID=UPI0033C32B30